MPLDTVKFASSLPSIVSLLVRVQLTVPSLSSLGELRRPWRIDYRGQSVVGAPPPPSDCFTPSTVIAPERLVIRRKQNLRN